MAHVADSWISKAWMGKTVRQISSCDGPDDPNVGRTSVVMDTLFDEKGALHINTADGHWCPAFRLEIVD